MAFLTADAKQLAARLRKLTYCNCLQWRDLLAESVELMGRGGRRPSLDLQQRRKDWIRRVKEAMEEYKKSPTSSPESKARMDGGEESFDYRGASPKSQGPPEEQSDGS